MSKFAFRPITPLLFFLFSLGALAQTDPLDAADRRLFADGLSSRRLYARAAAEYEALLKDFPQIDGRDVVLFRWGEALRETKRTEEADAVFTRLVAECPDSPYRVRGLFNRGALALSANRFGDAAGFFDGVLKTNPEPAVREDALYYLGESLSKDNRGAEAIPHFEAFLKEFPSSEYAPYAKVSLALALERRAGDAKNADSEKARALFREAASASDPAVAAEALYLRGQCDFARGDYAASAEAFAELRKRFPQSPRAAEAASRAAWASERSDKPAETLALAEAALADPAVPHRDEWLYLQGRALFQLGRFEDSAKAMMTIINDFDASEYTVSAAYASALAYERAKHYQEALPFLGVIPADDPLRPRILRLAASCAEALGDRAALETDCYKELCERFPDDPDAADSLYRYARCLQAAKRWSDAAARYAEYAKRFPAGPQAAAARYAGGVCHKAAGKTDDALAAWGALVRDYPQDALAPDACYLKAVEEFRLERQDAALADFDALLAFGDRVPAQRRTDAHFWRGCLLAQLGRHAEALEALRTAEKASTQDAQTDEIRYQLWYVLQKLERLDEAADVLSKLLDRPTLASRIQPKQVAWAIEHQYHRGRMDEARQAARFLAKSSEEPEWKQTAWGWTGRIEAARGDPAAAEAAYRAAADIPTTTRYAAEAFLRVGEFRLAAKDYEAAEKRFERAIELAQPKDLAEVRIHATVGLARAWRELGRKEDAARQFLGVCMVYQDPVLIPQVIQEAVPLLRELGRNDEADVLLQDLHEVYGK